MSHCPLTFNAQINQTQVDRHPLMHTPMSLLTIFSLAFTLFPGIFTSKANQFIVNMVKFSKAVNQNITFINFLDASSDRNMFNLKQMPRPTDGSKGTKTVELK